MTTVTKDIKGSVQAQFGQVAANYSTSTVHAKGADLDAMLTAMPLDGTERVLDAGTGTGHTALAFAQRTGQVVAVDFTENMLGQGRLLAAERGIANVEFRLGDVEHLPADNGEFDIVVSRYSAHHWPHPQQALQEFVRVLKPGGTLILNDIVSYDDFVCDTYLQAIEVLRDPSHVRDHSIAQWRAMIAEAGFTESTVVYQGDVYIEFLNWTDRMQTPAANVQMIRNLFDGAPEEFRKVFKIDDNHNFCFTGAVIRASAANS